MRKNNLYEPLFFPPSLRPNSVLVLLFNMQKIEYWDTVSKYLDDNYRIKNKEAREITGITDTTKMSRMLKQWLNKGLLERVEKGFKGNFYYKKIGIEIPKKFDYPFASKSENV